MLQEFRIQRLVDVRSSAKSRRNPQYSAQSLESALGEQGIGYSHRPQLGGIPGGAPENNDNSIANKANDYMPGMPNLIAKQSSEGHDVEHKGIFWNLRQPKGLKVLDEIMAATKSGERWCIMCAEGPWRHCHRQVISTAVQQKGVAVIHITPVEEHSKISLKFLPNLKKQIKFRSHFFQNSIFL